jgi:hypothetical protein
MITMRTPHAAMRRAAALVAPLLLAGALAGLGPVTAQAATAGCQNWTGLQPPGPGTASQLNSVTVLSACGAWAVGAFTDASNVRETLIEHWDGANWTVVPSPSPGSTNNFLASVRAASPTSIWAVGGFAGDDHNERSLILHWDGKSWTQQDTPAAGDNTNVLNGVRPVSGTEAWAVGEYGQGITEKSLLLHFKGGRWTQVTTKQVSADDAIFGVAATSAKDVWAVGITGSEFETAKQRPARMPLARSASRLESTLILHWNGKTWTHVPSPNPGMLAELKAVGATSPSNVWAVGLYVQDRTERPLILHWNGKTWSRVNSPASGGTALDELTSVSVSSARNVWAAGTTFKSSTSAPLIVRWSGSRWTRLVVPVPGASAQLLGVGASSDSSVWGVGFLQTPSSVQTLALHCC